MLAHVHSVRFGADEGGRAVVAAVLSREADQSQLRASDNPSTLTAGVLQYAVIVRDLTLAHDLPISTCADGLFKRVKILIQSGLLPPGDYPSIFWRIAGHEADVIKTSIDQAARASGAPSLDFPALEPAEASTGGMLARLAATSIANDISAQGDVTKVVGSFRKQGMPSGWLHYTLDRDCRCPGCSAVLNAVPPAVLPPPREVRRRPPRPALLITSLRLPTRTYQKLMAAGIGTMARLQEMDDRQLLRLQDVGPEDVAAIREALASRRP